MTMTETRNATLADMAQLLTSQHEAKLDAVVPAAAIRSVGGTLHIDGMSFEAAAGLGTGVAGEYRPTAIMDGHIAGALKIPVAYLRRLRDERPDLYDANVNGWLHGDSPFDPWNGEPRRLGDASPDPRKFLVRTFMDTSGEGPGVGRALLSNGYKVIDNLDVLMATLDGIRSSGRQVDVVSADLTETRMTVRVACPDLTAAAPRLLAGYRSPVDGYGVDLARLARAYSPAHLGWDASKGEQPPVVFAGFELTNSETGGGAFALTPRVVVAACKNGLKITRDIHRMVHLGARMDEGRIAWSEATQANNLALVRSMTVDAVETFLSQEYLDSVVADVEAKAAVELAHPADAVAIVAKQMLYTEDVAASILDHFIRGGQTTAAGIINAVTSVAQTLPADAAYELESSAMAALEVAANI